MFTANEGAHRGSCGSEKSCFVPILGTACAKWRPNSALPCSQNEVPDELVASLAGFKRYRPCVAARDGRSRGQNALMESKYCKLAGPSSIALVLPLSIDLAAPCLT